MNICSVELECGAKNVEVKISAAGVESPCFEASKAGDEDEGGRFSVVDCLDDDAIVELSAGNAITVEVVPDVLGFAVGVVDSVVEGLVDDIRVLDI